jgi:carboxylesterase type B
MLTTTSGGFEFGSTQLYDGGSMIKKSIALGQQVVFVAVNSRISGFGFLAGKELQDEGSTNLGLKDQRYASVPLIEHATHFP